MYFDDVAENVTDQDLQTLSIPNRKIQHLNIADPQSLTLSLQNNCVMIEFREEIFRFIALALTVDLSWACLRR
jgi:hypothetical protein